MAGSERTETIVVGGGQAGLAIGYHLRMRDLPFVIFDGQPRIGDAWRKRWDSLRLFTPARLNGLPGMRFPAPGARFPTKDEMADYLEAYASRFELPVRTDTRVDRLWREADRFKLASGERRFEADNVVVAMGSFQVPKIPSFADQLDPSIRQMHSKQYRNPGQLQDGEVLVVGAGNSGAEIGLEIARSHSTWLSGRSTGSLPFRVESPFARYVVAAVLPLVGNWLLTVDTPIGRRVRPNFLTRGGPLVRVKPDDLARAGVRRVPRVSGVRDGQPVLEDDRSLAVENVIWCTGFRPSFSWIDLPIFGGEQDPIEPNHNRGVVLDVPGLYFVGLWFQHSLSSGVIQGVGRDAEYVAKRLAASTTGLATDRS